MGQCNGPQKIQHTLAKWCKREQFRHVRDCGDSMEVEGRWYSLGYDRDSGKENGNYRDYRVYIGDCIGELPPQDLACNPLNPKTQFSRRVKVFCGYANTVSRDKQEDFMPRISLVHILCRATFGCAVWCTCCNMLCVPCPCSVLTLACAGTITT